MEYPVEAKKNLANFSVVLDTPEYKRVTELKTHLSNVSFHLQSLHKFAYSDRLFWAILTILFTAHLQIPEQAGNG